MCAAPNAAGSLTAESTGNAYVATLGMFLVRVGAAQPVFGNGKKPNAYPEPAGVRLGHHIWIGTETSIIGSTGNCPKLKKNKKNGGEAVVNRLLMDTVVGSSNTIIDSQRFVDCFSLYQAD